ncbi:MAG: hypothetical protein EPO13_02470 [Actinomycetota bacterium]|nr:MAG: hypothetical protein EPO13_02470 [Actinomycetota bacterium]
MASIEKRIQGAKTSYRVGWHEAGRRQSLSFDTHAEAIKFRGRVDAAGQKWPPPEEPGKLAPDLPTVTEWCTRSIDSRVGLGLHAARDYRAMLKNYRPG